MCTLVYILKIEVIIKTSKIDIQNVAKTSLNTFFFQGGEKKKFHALVRSH